jgi:Protein of unknown function (DUF4038)/Domain of unknown function (DUF5060)
VITITTLYPWQEIELTLTAEESHAYPYTKVEVWADFVHEGGTVLRRPAFWDGGNVWKIRFAATLEGAWSWKTFANVADAGLTGQSGELSCQHANSEHLFYKHGFWKMSPGGRNLVHADGTSALLVGDTAWGLPWRATLEQCEVYSRDRQQKGFNAVLLMTVQPDMKATGPRSRTEDFGFEVGFEDLPTGHINEINPEYFQYFDQLVDILVAHELVPVYQSVFHGYGWKGLEVAGPVIPSDEYARYCRYLVARYGARPAIYLPGGDGSGYLPQVGAGGEEIEHWDCYKQPTGIHYRPHADNRAYQDAAWLDFQWCQTGHNGEHVQERVADMWRNTPIKAVTNGEPTYENIGWMGNAVGWWQGHEAWANLCAGGTMGVIYGAGSLWQWRLHKDEPEYEAWAYAHEAGWREALDFEGSSYVGLVGKILKGLPLADMQPNWEVTYGRRGLLVSGKLFIVYLSEGGWTALLSEDVPRDYKVLDPRTGNVLQTGKWTKENPRVETPRGEPRVILFTQESINPLANSM